MHESKMLLSEFLKDFQVETEETSVCFTARITFGAVGLYKQIETPVNMVTLGKTGMSALYLLHPDILQLRIPDYIRINNVNELYLLDKTFTIKGTSPYHGNFIMRISILAHRCQPGILQEVKMKEKN